MSAPSAISIILVTPDPFGSLLQTLRHVRAQDIASRIEAVFVVPSAGAFDLDETALEGLGEWQVVEVGVLRSNAHGYAEGVRNARAPIVVFGEDHCFPSPGWAAALLARHEGPYAAVGPVVAHANSPGTVAWSDSLLGYGPWLYPHPGGEVEYLPGHNSSYKRDALLEYGDELESWLEAESVLHWDLRSKGARLYLEPEARTNHFSFSSMRAWIAASFHTSRTFAARRVRDSRASLVRRVLYTAASPLIPAVRMRRCLRDIRRVERPPSMLRLIPALGTVLVVSAFGEAVGYSLGPGDSPALVSQFEFRRDRNMTERDQRAMAAARFFE
ncbi:MAG: hypothetical protein R3195_10435 [Gemmatimonadota bacterium]|nr:hypothetical protein [Gemmatimonadota bacterium]